MGLFARTKSIVAVSLMVAALSAGAFGFILYRILNLNASASELSTALLTEGSREVGLRSLQNLLKDLETEEAVLNSRFIDPEGIVPFIELLEKAGKDAGVTVEVVSVGIQPEAEKQRPYEWLRVAVRGEGVWAKLFHFMILVETLPYAVTLDQVGLLEQSTGEVSVPSKALWEGSFVLRAAKLKDPEP